MFSFTLKKAEKMQSMVNVEEAYSLWDLLTVRYQMVDRINIWLHFAHDPGFRLLLQKALDDAKTQADLLEKQLRRYSIGGPVRPRKQMSTSVNSELFLDEDLGGYLLQALQEDIELLLRAIRTSTTNDSIRALFIKLSFQSIATMNNAVQYLKMKGWINQPPMYPNVPANVQEKIDAGEAFHLWDHLTYRYDNIEQTQFWYEYAHDGDFKSLLKEGLQGTLEKQAAMLEKEMLHFGLPLPKRPPGVIQAAQNTMLAEDQYMFRILYIGIVGAMWIHVLGYKQSLTNDRVRGIFKELLTDEINVLDQLIKFGKVKGWLHPAPQYSTAR